MGLSPDAFSRSLSPADFVPVALVASLSSSDPEAVFRDPVPDLSNVSDVPTFEQRFDPAEDEPWLDA